MKIEKLEDSKNYFMTKIKQTSIKNPGKNLSDELKSFYSGVRIVNKIDVFLVVSHYLSPLQSSTIYGPRQIP